MTLRLNGSTSGYVEIDAPAVAGASVLTLPSGVGTLLKAEGGKVLQIVRATDAILRTTASASFVDVTGMSVTITPQKSNSAILVVSNFVVDVYGTIDALDGVLQIADSSNNGISGAQESYFIIRNMAGSGSRQLYLTQTLIGYAAPATTSPVTYKLRFKMLNGGAMEIQNGISTGQMYAIEVSA